MRARRLIEAVVAGLDARRALQEAECPLTAAEKRTMGKVNVFIMDWEMDGGSLPPDIEKLASANRPLTPSEARKLIAWFHRTAPGDY